MEMILHPTIKNYSSLQNIQNAKKKNNQMKGFTSKINNLFDHHRARATCHIIALII